MISRYATKELQKIWSEHTKYKTWFQIELAACKSMELAKIIPVGTYSKINKNIEFVPNEIEEIEKITKHDVVAFLEYLSNKTDNSKWLHFGLTSSDILDTSLSLRLLAATYYIENSLNNIIESLTSQINKHSKTLVIGRSHGIHAEPITFGVVLAGHLAEFKRAKQKLHRAKKEISVGKISGPVGCYNFITPEVEKNTLKILGLYPETVSTQVVARDRYAYYCCMLSFIASAIERFSTNMRHWQRTEVNEVMEKFSHNQKGSSAMPHKQNPILSENLCGLARVVRSNMMPAMENISLWHERDISHSSVERIILPNSTSIIHFMLKRLNHIIINMQVNTEQMKENLRINKNRCFSSFLLLSLIKHGLTRMHAYQIVQEIALESIEENICFKHLALSNASVNEILSYNEIRKCFDISNILENSLHIIKRVVC